MGITYEDAAGAVQDGAFLEEDGVAAIQGGTFLPGSGRGWCLARQPANPQS